MTRISLFSNYDVVGDRTVSDVFRDVEEQAVLADRLGFDGVWLAEHHFGSFGKTPAPLVVLARLSALAPHLTLGTAIAEAPHYHPLRLAEEAAVLDLLSGGRLALGLGSGTRGKEREFELFGIPVDERSARTRDAARIVTAAFDRDAFDFAGEVYRFNGAEVYPRPVQTGTQAVWVAASDNTVEVAAELGIGILLSRVLAPERRQDLLRRYRDGLGGRPGRVAPLVFAFPAQTDEEAWRTTEATVRHYGALQAADVGWDGTLGTAAHLELLDRINFVVGSVETVTEGLHRFAETNGADELLVQVYAGASEQAAALRAIELFAAEVLPTFRPGAGDRAGAGAGAAVLSGGARVGRS